MVCCKRDESKATPKNPFGPETPRKCTDVLFLIAFIAFVIGMIVLMGVAVSKGDYKLITNGVDFRGCTCGTKVKFDADGTCVQSTDDDAIELPSKSVFVAQYESANLDFENLRIVCADACPGGYEDGNGADFDAAALCYPRTGGAVYPANMNQSISGQLQSLSSTCTVSNPPSENGPFFTYKAKSYLGYCAPTSTTRFSERMSSITGSKQWTAAFSSINNGAGIIAAMAFVGLLVAFIYTWLLNWVAKPLTVISIILVEVFILLGAYMLLLQANKIADENSDYENDSTYQMSYYGSIATFALGGVYLCVMCFMWKRIMLAVEIVKLAGISLRATPFVIFLPILMIVLGIVVFALWCITAVYIFSMGDVKPISDGSPIKQISLDDSARNAFFFHLFGLFWLTQFLVAMSEMTVGFVACGWFFAETENESDGNGRPRRKLPASPTFTAFKTVMRYHLGSVAFGSLLVAIVKFIRAMIEYAERKVKQAKGDSKLIKAVACCCRCCFWCLEKCIRFLNRNAYIMIALTGRSFCSSASAAFRLIMSNLARVGALAAVSHSFIFLGKALVAATAGGLSYVIFTQSSTFNDPSKDTYVAPLVPVAIVVLLGWAMGSLFMSVYATTIDAMLLCYIYNEEHHILDADFNQDLGRLNAKYKKSTGGGGGGGTPSETEPIAAANPVY